MSYKMFRPPYRDSIEGRSQYNNLNALVMHRLTNYHERMKEILQRIDDRMEKMEHKIADLEQQINMIK